MPEKVLWVQGFQLVRGLNALKRGDHLKKDNEMETEACKAFEVKG